MSDFKIGQKVRFINNGPTPCSSGWAPNAKPTIGKAYTVIRIGYGIKDSAAKNTMHVWLEEIQNISPSYWVGDAGYFAWRFESFEERRKSDRRK